MPRAPTWARMTRPSTLATSNRDSISRHVSGVTCDCMSDTESGRPEDAAMSRKMANSAAGSSKSEITCRTPVPRAPRADAMPTSSSAAAVRLGVCSPRLDLWLTVREVVNPRAPARTASLAKAAMAAMSSAVAGSRLAPRSPMTWSRRGPCGTCVAMSTSRGRRSSASR